MFQPIVFADTHTHLYAEQFDTDRSAMIQRAVQDGVRYMFLPNIDSTSIEQMHQLTALFPENCFPMMGLHPCSVKPDTYDAEMQLVENYLFNTDYRYVAIGEIGIDLHWDKTTLDIQKKAFIQQLEWAKTLQLPVSVHCREAFNETMECIEQVQDGTLKGVIHCFGGGLREAQRVVKAGFFIGIGGVATFKNRKNLAEAIAKTPIENIVLETDAPYLSPEPYRGKRNESAYIPIIAAVVAQIRECTIAEIAQKTTQNALNIFQIHTVNLHPNK
jgi:TatD DNase family protein